MLWSVAVLLVYWQHLAEVVGSTSSDARLDGAGFQKTKQNRKLTPLESILSTFLRQSWFAFRYSMIHFI